MAIETPAEARGRVAVGGCGVTLKLEASCVVLLEIEADRLTAREDGEPLGFCRVSGEPDVSAPVVPNVRVWPELRAS